MEITNHAMTNILIYTAWVELALFIALLFFAPLMLWEDYLAVMNIKRVRDMGLAGGAYSLSKLARALGAYVLIRGYMLDMFVNVIHMTILLWEWPKELTVTSRLHRHIRDKTEHAVLCLEIRTKLLDGFDPNGIH